LYDEVQIVIMNPDLRKIVRDAQDNGIVRGFEAYERLEPHLKNILRE
jgi:hypothetical protein